MDTIKKVLLNRNALCHEYIQPAQIKKTLEEHCNKRINRRLRIWSLLCFELWLKTFMDGQVQKISLGLNELCQNGETQWRKSA